MKHLYFVMVSMKMISSYYKDKWLLNWTQNQKRKFEIIHCTYFKPVSQLLTGETQTIRRSREIFLNRQTFVNVNFNHNWIFFLISQPAMGRGPLRPVVKFHWMPQQDSFCNIRLIKLSQLFYGHWKMKSMHKSEKLLKFIYPDLLPQAWFWKIVFSLEFVFHFVCFPFKSNAIIKELEFFYWVYDNKPFSVSNLCVFDHDHGIWHIIKPLLLSYVNFDCICLAVENVHC